MGKTFSNNDKTFKGIHKVIKDKSIKDNRKYTFHLRDQEEELTPYELSIDEED